MNDKKHYVMLSGYVDGELTPEQIVEFERRLADDPELRKELDAFRKLKEVTGAVKYADIPQSVWQGYWQSLYRRLERGTGWILLSISAILLLGIGAYCLCMDFFLNPDKPILLKIAVGAGILGLVVLLVSVIRERLFAYNRDRYKEVTR